MASWQINGLDIDTATVKVLVTPRSLAFSEAMRRQDIPLLHGTMKSHLLGRNLPAWRFRFEFIGPSPDRYTRLLSVRNSMRGFSTFELEAPSDSEVVFEDSVKSITLSLVSLRASYGDGVDMVVMEVDALHVDPDDTSGLGSGGVLTAQFIMRPIFVGRIQQPITAGAAFSALPTMIPTVTAEPVTTFTGTPTFTPDTSPIVASSSMAPQPVFTASVEINP